MSKLTKAIHREFVIVDKVAFIGYRLPSTTIRNDVLVLLLNSLGELEKTNPNSEIIEKLKVELNDFKTPNEENEE